MQDRVESDVRLALGVEYDGSAYRGWQTQSHAPSVQDTIEDALSYVADHRVRVICAGRTDSGVHATGQVVHFDTTAVRRMRSWTLGANANLPDDVSVTWICPVGETFHARFDAVARQYRYVILNRLVRPALLRRRVSWEHDPLDVQLMAKAAVCLVGEHDFSSFRAVACQARHPVRTVHSLTVGRSGDFVYLDILANGFLHHMVRTIAGTLMAVGRGERPAAWVREVLDARNRTSGGATAPPDGLYLVGVKYPESSDLPQRICLPVYG